MGKQNGKGTAAPKVEEATKTTEKTKDGVFLDRVSVKAITTKDKDGKDYINSKGTPFARVLFTTADGKSASFIANQAQIYDATKKTKDGEIQKLDGWKNILVGKQGKDVKVRVLEGKGKDAKFVETTMKAEDIKAAFDGNKAAFKEQQKAAKAAEKKTSKTAAKDEAQADAPDAI